MVRRPFLRVHSLRVCHRVRPAGTGSTVRRGQRRAIRPGIVAADAVLLSSHVVLTADHLPHDRAGPPGSWSTEGVLSAMSLPVTYCSRQTLMVSPVPYPQRCATVLGAESPVREGAPEIWVTQRSQFISLNYQWGFRRRHARTNLAKQRRYIFEVGDGFSG
jgi:hypothetical protein